MPKWAAVLGRPDREHRRRVTGKAQGGPAVLAADGAGGGSVDDMLDRFPTITVTDLKTGDMIAVASSKGATPDRIKAFKLLAGVEPFVRMAQMAAAGTNRGQGGSNLNISIRASTASGFNRIFYGMTDSYLS